MYMIDFEFAKKMLVARMALDKMHEATCKQVPEAENEERRQRYIAEVHACGEAIAWLDRILGLYYADHAAEAHRLYKESLDDPNPTYL
jgi:hypothetical protein